MVKTCIKNYSLKIYPKSCINIAAAKKGIISSLGISKKLSIFITWFVLEEMLTFGWIGMFGKNKT